MKDFVNSVLSNIKKFKKITIYTKDIIFIQSKVLQLLELKDMNQLRDRFEGIYFYDKLLTRLLSTLALEKLLNIKIVEIENIKNSEFEINLLKIGLDVEVKSFKFGELPILNKNISKSTIFTMYKEPNIIFICGFIDKNSLIQNVKDCYIYNRNKLKNKFIGFDRLVSFTSLKELIKIYEHGI
jgi:hypothetical protein